MLNEHVARPRELALIVQQCIAETGDASYLLDVPEEVRAITLDILQQFRGQGEFILFTPQSGTSQDRTPQAQAAVDVLVSAGYLPREAPQFEPRIPFFSGGEYLTDGAPLVEAIGPDMRFLSARLVTAGAHGESLLQTYPTQGLMTIQFERTRRRYDGPFQFRDVRTHSFAATLACTGRLSMQLSRFAAHTYLDSIRFAPSRRRWPRTGIDMDMRGFDFEAAIHCETIELRAFEMLELPHED